MSDYLSPRLRAALAEYGPTPPDPSRCTRCGRDTPRPITCQVLLLQKGDGTKNGKSIGSRSRRLCDDCAADVLRAAAECMDDEHWWEVIENLRSAADGRRVQGFNSDHVGREFS